MPFRFSSRAMVPIVAIASLTGLPAQTLESVLAQMDGNAASFKTMSAKLRQVSHTEVINEDNTAVGTVRLKRSRRDVRMAIDFTEPDPKSVAFQGNKAEIYYPKLRTVEEYGVGRNRGLVEEFLLVGFGTSGKELTSDNTITLLGVETVGGQKASHLQMIPKSKQVLQHFKRIDLWISNSTGYPLQHKLFQSGGDYMVVSYSEVKINPSLPDSAFKINAPSGVKRVSPQK